MAQPIVACFTTSGGYANKLGDTSDGDAIGLSALPQGAGNFRRAARAGKAGFRALVRADGGAVQVAEPVDLGCAEEADVHAAGLQRSPERGRRLVETDQFNFGTAMEMANVANEPGGPGAPGALDCTPSMVVPGPTLPSASMTVTASDAAPSMTGLSPGNRFAFTPSKGSESGLPKTRGAIVGRS